MNKTEKIAPRRRRGRPHKSAHARTAIQTLAALGYSDRDIRDWFRQHLGAETVRLPTGQELAPWYEPVPDRATIAKYAAAYRTDPSDAWDPITAPPDQVARVAPVAAAVAVVTGGQGWPSNELAHLIECIMVMDPDLEPLIAYLFALDLRQARARADAVAERFIVTLVALRSWTVKGMRRVDRLLEHHPEGNRLRATLSAGLLEAIDWAGVDFFSLDDADPSVVDWWSPPKNRVYADIFRNDGAAPGGGNTDATA